MATAAPPTIEILREDTADELVTGAQAFTFPRTKFFSGADNITIEPDPADRPQITAVQLLDDPGDVRYLARVRLFDTGEVHLVITDEQTRETYLVVNDQHDLSTDFETLGEISILAGNRLLTVQLAGVDQVEPYEFRPGNADDVIAAVAEWSTGNQHLESIVTLRISERPGTTTYTWVDHTHDLLDLSMSYGTSISVDPAEERLVEGHGRVRFAELDEFSEPHMCRVRAAGLELWRGLIYEPQIEDRHSLQTVTCDLRSPVGFGTTVTIPAGEMPLSHVKDLWLEQTRAATHSPPGIELGAIQDVVVDAGGEYDSAELLMHIMHVADGYVVSSPTGGISLVSPDAVRLLDRFSIDQGKFVDSVQVTIEEGQVRNIGEWTSPDGSVVASGQVEASVRRHGERRLDLPPWFRTPPTQSYQTRMLKRRSDPPRTISIRAILAGDGLGASFVAYKATQLYALIHPPAEDDLVSYLYLITGRQLRIRDNLVTLELHGVAISTAPGSEAHDSDVWILGVSRLGVEAILAGVVGTWTLGTSRLGDDTILA